MSTRELPPLHHWDAYNARSLRDEEVASRFVPSIVFESLLSPHHQLVVGPRGSGKTTLLRMLQRSSLSKWEYYDAERIRGSISFEGIFIPADRSWGEQFRSEAIPAGAENTFALLTKAKFTTHILRSVVRTLLIMSRSDSELADGQLALSKDDEKELSSSLQEAWAITEGLASFNGLRNSLRMRLSHLGRLSQQLLRGEPISDIVNALPWIDLDFLVETANSVEMVNDFIGQDGKRWALLFDELEVAPDEIRDSLMRSLRVPDTHLVLKLALSPYPGSTMSLSDTGDYPSIPREGNDFDLISLSSAQRVTSDKFARQILDSLVRSSARLESSPEELFGPSRIVTPAAQWLSTGNAYGPGSVRMKQFEQYIKSDVSVANYLTSHNISLENIGLVKPNQRSAHLRKIAPLVSLREYFSKESSGKTRRYYRQRKTYDFYTGLTSLLGISEGNPRTILYLFGPMLEEAAATGLDRVDLRVQDRAIQSLVASFRTLLRTIPAPSVGSAFAATGQEPARRGLLDFLDHIGEYFADSVYSNEFSPDPTGSFIVDSNVPLPVLSAIESAVNIGALVFIPDDYGLDYFGSARGKRFRLNYLLSAYHRLPLRIGRPVSLSSIFESKIDAGRADELQLFETENE